MVPHRSAPGRRSPHHPPKSTASQTTRNHEAPPGSDGLEQHPPWLVRVAAAENPSAGSKVIAIVDRNTDAAYTTLAMSDQIKDVLNWMDQHFGHNLTDIVVHGTVIQRVVRAAFSHPRARGIAGLEGAVVALLSVGFSSHYRGRTWKEIADTQFFAQLVGQFSALKSMPEARVALTGTIQDAVNNIA